MAAVTIACHRRTVLAGLVLKIFLAILPMILAFMGRLQGLTSRSSVDFSVITKYFVFQVSHITLYYCSSLLDISTGSPPLTL